MRKWRTLLRLTKNGGDANLYVPSWDPHTELTIPMSAIPHRISAEMKEGEDYRCYAHAYLDAEASPENAFEALAPEQWERPAFVLPITFVNDPILREVAKPVDESVDDLHELIHCMIATMNQAKGVGIAAPQVGRSLRLFIALDGGNNPVAFINPEITYLSKRYCKISEGCLSIPGVRGEVARPETVKLKWLDADLQPQEKLFFGRDARIIQHEFDHLEGKLFTDYL